MSHGLSRFLNKEAEKGSKADPSRPRSSGTFGTEASGGSVLGGGSKFLGLMGLAWYNFVWYGIVWLK